MAFSVSKPYRMPIYDNYPLFFSLIVAYVCAFVVLFLPATNPFMWNLFSDVEFCNFTGNNPENPEGPCYPDYNYFIIIVGVVDTIITYVIEAFFIRKFTVKYDARKEDEKLTKFANEMEALIPQK
jgi:phosphotransferase system  glucose/maltose/N-acetylglucosamine-specific IIC component